MPSISESLESDPSLFGALRHLREWFLHPSITFLASRLSYPGEKLSEWASAFEGDVVLLETFNPKTWWATCARWHGRFEECIPFATEPSQPIPIKYDPGEVRALTAVIDDPPANDDLYNLENPPVFCLGHPFVRESLPVHLLSDADLDMYALTKMMAFSHPPLLVNDRVPAAMIPNKFGMGENIARLVTVRQRTANLSTASSWEDHLVNPPLPGSPPTYLPGFLFQFIVCNERGKLAAYWVLPNSLQIDPFSHYDRLDETLDLAPLCALFFCWLGDNSWLTHSLKSRQEDVTSSYWSFDSIESCLSNTGGRRVESTFRLTDRAKLASNAVRALEHASAPRLPPLPKGEDALCIDMNRPDLAIDYRALHRVYPIKDISLEAGTGEGPFSLRALNLCDNSHREGMEGLAVPNAAAQVAPGARSRSRH